MVGLQKMTVGPHLVNHIQGQRLVVDLHLRQGGPNPTHHLIADDELHQRTGQTRFEIAQIMNQVTAGESISHQSECGLDAGLLVNQFGVAAPAQGKHGQTI